MAQSLIPERPKALSEAEARAVMRLAWPDFWAEDLSLAVDGHDFSMKGREYEKQILRDESQWIDVPKAAQMGLTTVFIIRTCHWLINRNWHHLYLLPLKTGSVGFVQARIDTVIDSNRVLKRELTRTDNRTHKQTQRGINWYIRGTNIETELREVPSDVLIVDERDKANEDNLPTALARLDGSRIARVTQLSTPTIDGVGVYAEDAWAASDQMRWWVACPHCSSKQVLNFQENVEPWIDIKGRYARCCCSHCQKELTDVQRAEMNATGAWSPDVPNASKRGYHISQLNSPTKPLNGSRGIMANYFGGLFDSKLMKAFFNDNLGLAYAAPGDKFTVELLDSLRADYSCGGIPMSPIRIGVDVGHDVLHVVMDVYDQHSNRVLWNYHIVTGDGTRKKWQVFEEDYLQKLGTWICIADAHPDKEECEALSKRYPGRFWMGFEKDNPNQPVTADFNKPKWGEVGKVNIDRTMAFDGTIKQALQGRRLLPREARELGELMPKLGYNGFYHQMLQQARVEQAATGTVEREVARWVKTRQPDHAHHADMFAFIAGMADVPFSIPVAVGSLFQQAGGFIAS